jgi:hypothetical protein
LRVLRQKKVGQLRNFVGAFAQWRDVRLDHLQTVVEVFTEFAAHHHLLEVAVGRGDHAHIDVDLLVASKLGELGVLEHVKQLCLQCRFHLADLVEEDRAAVRLLEFADAGRGRAGERAFLVAEQLALEQLRGQGSAVDLDEGLVAARGALMNRTGDEFLAYAALAANQHGDIAVGYLLDDERHLAHDGTLAPADERVALIVAQLPAQIGQLVHQTVALEGLFDRRIERDLTKSFGIVGLDHVVGGAEANGFDNRCRVLAARQHDDLQLGSRRFQRLQRLQTVHARHRDVEQHDVRRLALADRGDDFIPARVGACLVTAESEESTQIAGEARVVIDDSDIGRTTIVGWSVAGFRAGARSC